VLDQLIADVGAPVARVIFDRGVETFRAADGRWRLPHPLGELAAPSADPHALVARHGLRPVVLASTGPLGATRTHLVSAAGTLGWRPPIERLYEDAVTAGDALRLRYLVDALDHHCTRLAESYGRVNMAARRLMAAFGTRELAVLSGQPEPYYEFDALLSCAARAYETVRSLVWVTFGDDGLARSRRAARRYPARRFDDFVRDCRRTPAVLRDALLESWSDHGADVNAYRRCLHHLDAADFGYASVRLRLLDDDLWAVSVPIPDNPRVGARQRYTFANRLDALDYGWSLTTEVMRVVSLTVLAVTDHGLDDGVRFGRPFER
jgi:hypothetical protein